MGIEANVTNQQITASVGETQIDATVSGGVGPTGPSGVVTVSAPLVNSGTSSAASLSLAIGTGLEVSGGQLRLPASGVVAGSYSTVTVDATGRVTAGSTHAVTWNDVSGKPSTFTPSAHAGSHGAGGDDEIEIEGGQVRIAADAQNASSLAEGSIAATFLHTANANGVPAALPIATANARGAVRIGGGVSIDANGVISVSTNYAAASHTHAPADISFAATDRLLGRSSSGAGAGQEIVCTSAGRALLDDADAAAQRTTLGLGTAAAADIGTGSTQVAAGDHTHAQLHDRSHAITSTSDHTAGNWKVFYSNGSGQVVELALGNSGQYLTANGTAAAPTFTTPSSGGSTNVWIPASAFIPRTTNGPGVDSRETSTNKQNFDEVLFDAAAIEYADALLILPNNYNNSTVTARFYWTASSGSGDVVFAIAGRAFANDDALDTAYGTAQSATDTLLSANDMHVSAATSAMTLGGTPAANTPAQFTVYRDATNAGDTLAVDARLIGVEIIYTAA